jgi:hypothetical protein
VESPSKILKNNISVIGASAMSRANNRIDEEDSGEYDDDEYLT